jgi:hypothetical protein
MITVVLPVSVMTFVTEVGTDELWIKTGDTGKTDFDGKTIVLASVVGIAGGETIVAGIVLYEDCGKVAGNEDFGTITKVVDLIVTALTPVGTDDL